MKSEVLMPQPCGDSPGIGITFIFFLLLILAGPMVGDPAICIAKPLLGVAPGMGQPTSVEEVAKQLQHLPHTFELNKGQINSHVKFISRTSQSTLLLTAEAAILSLAASSIQTAAKPPRVDTVRAALRVELAGANHSPRLVGESLRSGTTNYLIGNNRSKWIRHVPHYSRVRYAEVYPGVDWVFYSRSKHLEYDFVVSPGADPGAIRLRFMGAKKLTIDGHGNLVLDTEAGQIKHHKPVVYQQVNHRRYKIAGGYERVGAQEVRFKVGAYDRLHPLVIDPVVQVIFSLTEGEQQALSVVHGLDIDPAGNIYLFGVTNDDDLPITSGAYQTDFAGGQTQSYWPTPSDAFVAKLLPNGADFVYLTYLGGSQNETATYQALYSGGIAVDNSGHAYVAGHTQSNNFPYTPDAFQTAISGPADAFVTKLNPDGDDLVYSTYLGGDAYESAKGIDLDSQNQAHVIGATTGSFPVTAGAYQTANPGGSTSFLTKLNTDGTALLYSTLFGGSGDRDEPKSVALDAQGKVWVVGETRSSDMPTKNALQTDLKGPRDGFIAKFDPAGHADASLLFATYWGSIGFDHADAVTVDGDGNAYIAGDTTGPGFPIQNAVQSSMGGQQDAFLTKLSAQGNLVFSTYLGGNEFDETEGVAVDSTGKIYVSGFTHSTDFPPRDPAHQGLTDFVVALNPDGASFDYQTILSVARYIALDPYDNLVAVGVRPETDTPIVVTRIWPSRDYRFVVLADSRGDKNPCAADIQDCVNRSALQDIFTAIDQLSPPPDFLFFTGDMIYGVPKTGDRIEQELNVWVAAIENADDRGDSDPSNDYLGRDDDYVKKNIYPVFGGHERNEPGGNYPTPFTAFSNFFDPVQDGQAGLICQYMSNDTHGHTAYFCDFGPDRFFILNNDCIPPDTEQQVDSLGCVKDEMGDTQMAWIQQNLRGDGHNFFFHHEPAYSVAAHNAAVVDDTAPIVDEYSNIIDPTETMDCKKKLRNDYIQLIGDHATMLFAGHEHHYFRRRIDHDFVNREVNIDKAIVLLAYPLAGAGTGPRTAESFYTENGGSPGQAPLLEIIYKENPSADQKTFRVRIKSIDGDAEELIDGTMSMNSSDLEFMLAETGVQKAVGMRWTGIKIPQDAVIVHAYIYFTADETSSAPAGLKIYGENAAYPEPFTATPNNLTLRNRTTQYVDWNPAGWTTVGSEYQSPDLKEIIKEVISQPGWHGELDLNSTFFEVKTGSSGAPWYEKNKKAYTEYGEEGRRIGLDDSEPTPYHYAVVTVTGDTVQLEIYAITDTDPIDQGIISRAAATASGPMSATLIDLSNRHLLQHLDTDFDGAINAEEKSFNRDSDNQEDDADKDTLRILTATGRGSIVFDADEATHEGIAFRRAYTAVDTASDLPLQNKPVRDFSYGLVAFTLIGLNPGETVTLNIKLPDEVPEVFDYYEAAGWQLLPFVHDQQDAAAIQLDLTDGGAGDQDGVANGIIDHMGGLASPPSQEVNSFVAFEILEGSETFQSEDSPCRIGVDFDSGVSGSYAGIKSYTALLENISQETLSDLIVRVESMTNGNGLLNADMAPSGQGASLTVAPAQEYTDGQLGPGESVDVPLRFCVREDTPFTLEVNINGRVARRDVSGDADAFRLLTGENDLQISLAAQAEVDIDSHLVYKISLSNNGPSDATNVILSDVLPMDTVFVSAGCEQGVCEASSNRVTCRIDHLNAQGTATAEVIVACPNTGTLTNTVTVTANESDPDHSNNSATAHTIVEGIEPEPTDDASSSGGGGGGCFFNTMLPD